MFDERRREREEEQRTSLGSGTPRWACTRISDRRRTTGRSRPGRSSTNITGLYKCSWSASTATQIRSQYQQVREDDGGLVGELQGDLGHENGDLANYKEISLEARRHFPRTTAPVIVVASVIWGFLGRENEERETVRI